MMTTATATGAIHGIYPWNEPKRKTKSESASLYGCDTKAQIALCLGCTRVKCVNCLEHKAFGYKARTSREDKQCRMREQFKRLWLEGLKAKQICETMHIGTSTYYRYLNDCTKEGVR